MLLNCSPIPDVFFSSVLLKRSLILSINPLNFFIAINIPPPANPANISPIEILSVIQLKASTNASLILPATFKMKLKASTNASLIFPATFEIKLCTLENILPNPLRPLVAFSKTLDIPPKALDTASEIVEKNFPVLAPSLRDVKKSPMAAVISKNKSAKLFIPFDCDKS